MEEIQEKNMRVFPVVDDAELRYEELKDRKFQYINLPPENRRVIPGVGDVVDDEEMFQIRQSIKSEALKYGFPSKNRISDSVKSDFDKTVGKILFNEMNITPSVAATLPMWHFFSIYLIPDIIFWRWNVSKDHFISPRRNYCGTQWWRYYLFSENAETLEVFHKMSDGDIADLYERAGTSGLPNHITDIAIWFDKLDETNTSINPRDLKRETIKLYNAELGYRLYYALSTEDRFELFKASYLSAFGKLSRT